MDGWMDGWMDGRGPGTELEPVSRGEEMCQMPMRMGTSGQATAQEQGQGSQLKEGAASEPSQLAPAITTKSPFQRAEVAQQEKAW